MKDHPEYQYLNLMQEILDHGVKKPVYGAKTHEIGVFGRQLRFDLSYGFPLLTTKKVFMRGITHELLWFLQGNSNIKYLVDNNVHIWDEWGYKRYKDQKSKIPVITNYRVNKDRKLLTQEEYIQKIKDDTKFAKQYGELGPVYGVQWRKWPTHDKRTIDQLGWVINKLKNPKQFFRRHLIVSAWNPEYIYEMAVSRDASVVLPPCHTMYHFNVIGGKLSLQLYQRSADLFLGVPFNIASYALLLSMVAQVTGLEPGEFVHTFGDVHIYSNHLEQVREQLKRKPKPFPKLKLNPKVKNIDDFTFADIEVVGYDPHPPIKGDVTVVGGF